jgi:hypothetical protein
MKQWIAPEQEITSAAPHCQKDLIRIIRSAPADLSSNRKYFDQFGNRGSVHANWPNIGRDSGALRDKNLRLIP